MFKKTLFFGLTGLLAACVPMSDRSGEPVMTHINLIDQNGLSETISNEDRLAQYRRVDFTQPQPYQKVMRVYRRDPLGDIRSVITSYHPNGQIKQYLEVLNNTAHGCYREWHPNGVLKLEGYIVSGTGDVGTAAEQSWLFDGCTYAWDDEGRLLANIPYLKGELHGDSLYYHSNGTLWKRVPFCRGKINGLLEIYLENGDLLTSGEFCDSLKQGKCLRYWQDGSTSAEEYYDKGFLVSGIYYDCAHQTISEIKDGNGFRAIFGKDCCSELQEYHEGVQDGLVKIFAENGDLVSTHHIKDGLKHGEEIEYYPKKPRDKDLKPNLLLNWYQGNIQGIVKTWYPNGAQESQREMSENQKNGLLTAWYENGSLMMIEEYDRDVLQKGKYFKLGEKRPVSEVRDGSGTVTLFDPNGTFLRRVEYKKGKPLE